MSYVKVQGRNNRLKLVINLKNESKEFENLKFLLIFCGRPQVRLAVGGFSWP